MARRRRAESIGAALEEYVSALDPGGKRHRSRAALVWPEIAGEEIVRHTRGFAVRKSGELVVLVDSPAWANELALMSERLRVSLNERLGPDTVRSLRFTVSRAAPSAGPGGAEDPDEPAEPEAPEPLPLTESERAQAAHVAGAVADAGLREAALRVMVKDLERKKGIRAANAAETSVQPSQTADSGG